MAFTLTQYRAASAEQLGTFLTGTATSGSTSTVVECVSFGYKTSLSQDQLYKDAYVLRPAAVLAADKVRIIASAVSGSGQYTVDLAYTNAPYSGGVGESFEIHGSPVEPLTQMTRLINNALKRCFISDEVTVTPVSNAREHSLSAYSSWLLSPRWVYQVGYLESGEVRAQQNPFERVIRGRVIRRSGNFWIQHPTFNFSTTSTIYVKVIRPAWSYCATDSTFGTLQNGLSLETDVALPDPEWVAAGVVDEAWKEMGTLLSDQGDRRAMRDRAQSAGWFDQQTLKYADEPLYTFVPVPELGGPMVRSARVRYW